MCLQFSFSEYEGGVLKDYTEIVLISVGLLILLTNSIDNECHDRIMDSTLRVALRWTRISTYIL